ncbi:hypothetical protein Pan258_03320 [Symmachiella dynata]|nr:hypothetical protein Pan258_03320 [Symmachiella dynata]
MLRGAAVITVTQRQLPAERWGNGLTLEFCMSMLLCHECYSWVEPRGGHCPDCMAAVDINEADPPLSRLQTILGEVSAPLGEVTVRRRALPARGLLYATTNGLYFLPHLVDELADPERNHSDGMVLWSIASALWAPLSLCAIFLNWSPDELSRATTFHPQRLAPEQADALPRSLMENPGAFFVPSAMIQSISRRFGAWIIHRGHSTKLKLVPASPREAFDKNMFNLIATPPWKHVVT